MSAPLDDLMGNALTEPIVDARESGDFEIDVVDDRPEEDRVPPRNLDISVPAEQEDPGLDEVEEVTEASRGRIRKLKYDYHEERRAKEAAERMREEAVLFAEHHDWVVVLGQILGDLKYSLLDAAYNSVIFPKIHHYFHKPISLKAG